MLLKEQMETLRREKDALKASLESARDDAYNTELSQTEAHTIKEKQSQVRIQELEEQLRRSENRFVDVEKRMAEEAHDLEQGMLDARRRVEKEHMRALAMKDEEAAAAERQHSEALVERDAHANQQRRALEARHDQLQHEIQSLNAMNSELQRRLGAAEDDKKDYRLAKEHDMIVLQDSKERELQMLQAEGKEALANKTAEVERTERKLAALTLQHNTLLDEKANLEAHNQTQRLMMTKMQEDLSAERMQAAKEISEIRALSQEREAEAARLTTQLEELSRQHTSAQSNHKLAIQERDSEVDRLNRHNLGLGQEVTKATAEQTKLQLVFQDKMLEAENALQNAQRETAEKERELEFLRHQLSSAHVKQVTGIDLLSSAPGTPAAAAALYQPPPAKVTTQASLSPVSPPARPPVKEATTSQFNVEASAKAILDNAINNARSRASQLAQSPIAK